MLIFVLTLLVVTIPPLMFLVLAYRYRMSGGMTQWPSLMEAARVTSNIGSGSIALLCALLGARKGQLDTGIIVGLIGGGLTWLVFKLIGKIVHRLASRFPYLFEDIQAAVGPGSKFHSVTTHLTKDLDSRELKRIDFEEIENLKLAAWILYTIVLYRLTTPASGPYVNLPLVAQIVGCMIGAMPLVWLTFRLIPESFKDFFVATLDLLPLIVGLALIVLYFISSSASAAG